MPSQPNGRVQIYTYGDARYFPGIVALVNSLRITGNDEPVVVLDLGLEPAQRRVLASHCRFMTAGPPPGTSPWHLFPFPVFDDPSGVVAIVDSDVLVTTSLRPYFESAADGRIVAFPDPVPGRFFGEWEQVFALPSAPRPGQPYVNAGFVAFSTLRHPDLLARWWAGCERIAARRTALDDGVVANPVAFGDQDALNALLMSVVEPDRLAVQPVGAELFLESEFARMKVRDLARLRCELDGQPVSLLHHIYVDKAWAHTSWRGLRRTGYTRCLRRALAGPALEIRPAASEVPRWLRQGPSGAAAASLVYGRALLGRVRRRARDGRPSGGV